MGDFRRDRGSSGRGSRLGRNSSDRESGGAFGRPTSRFGSRGTGRGFGDREESGFGRRGTGSRFDGGKSRADYEMHKAICDRCGNECEVPFRPTSGKPVYCSDCYKNPEGPIVKKTPGLTPAGKPAVTSADIDKINEKLNKIMKALKIE